MAVEIDNLKSRDNHRLKISDEHTSDQDHKQNNFNKLKTRIVNDKVALKAEMERPRNIRLSPEPVAFYA